MTGAAAPRMKIKNANPTMATEQGKYEAWVGERRRTNQRDQSVLSGAACWEEERTAGSGTTKCFEFIDQPNAEAVTDPKDNPGGGIRTSPVNLHRGDNCPSP